MLDNNKFIALIPSVIYTDSYVLFYIMTTVPGATYMYCTFKNNKRLPITQKNKNTVQF